MSTLTVMAGAIIAPSLPQMSTVFADVPGAVFLSKLILSLPALFIGLAAPFIRYVLDYYGRIRVLLFSLVLYGLAGSSGVYLDNIYLLLIGRGLLGIAVAGIMTGATALIADYYAGGERNRLLGRQSMFMALGGVLFLSAGGMLADWHWRAPFMIYLVAMLLVWPVFRFLYEPDRSVPRHGANNSASAGFVFRLGYPAIFFAAFVGMALFYMIPIQIPFYLKTIGLLENRYAGFAIMATTVSSAMVAGQYQRIRRRLSFVQIFALAFAIIALAYLLISRADRYAIVVTALFFGGMGFGVFMPNANTWLVSLAPPALRGRLIGLLSMCFFLGQFLSPIITEPIIQATSIAHLFELAAEFMGAVAALYLIMAFVPNPLLRELKSDEDDAAEQKLVE
ncbi:MAG: MFS transporter [Leptospiraceae bacterium]|nr:MFS transporter [Leptospiraceae bacterium]